MMSVAIGDDSRLRQDARKGSRLVFGGYRGLRRWNSDLGFFSGFFVFMGIFGVGNKSGGSPGHPRGSDKLPRRALGGGRAPWLVASS